MTSQVAAENAVAAPAIASAHATPIHALPNRARRTPNLAKAVIDQITRFAPGDRHALAELAARSTQHADLQTSFPVATIALARRRGNMFARAEALEAISRGASLAQIAALLAAPLWTRRLPPAAAWTTLPDRSGNLAAAEDLARPVMPMRTNRWEKHRTWLGDITLAHCAGGESFAAWLALRIKDQPVVSQTLDPRAIGFLAAFNIFSSTQSRACKTPPCRPWLPNCASVMACMKRVAGLRWCCSDCRRATFLNPSRTTTSPTFSASVLNDCARTTRSSQKTASCAMAPPAISVMWRVEAASCSV